MMTRRGLVTVTDGRRLANWVYFKEGSFSECKFQGPLLPPTTGTTAKFRLILPILLAFCFACPVHQANISISMEANCTETRNHMLKWRVHEWEEHLGSSMAPLNDTAPHNQPGQLIVCTVCTASSPYDC